MPGKDEDESGWPRTRKKMNECLVWEACSTVTESSEYVVPILMRD